MFAGIGGFDLGLERAGMTPAWQVEIDDYCNRVLEKHWPDVRRYRDVKEVGKHNLEPVDLICGGFPCQPYSVAGKRKGADDDRNLWPDYLRIVRELRPTWVIGENVPGIVPMYLDQVLSDLEGEEYTCWTFNIPACALNAPHRRERTWIVGYSEHLGRNKAQTEGIYNETIREREKGENFSSIKFAGTSNSWDIPKERGNGKEIVANTTVTRLEGQVTAGINGREQGLSAERGWWTVEPNVGRVAHGVPRRVDRLRALGNAVVPQVAEFIGKQIMETQW